MTGLAERAAEAYLSGWALTDAPWTGRAEAGCLAAVETVLEYPANPAVLEVALQLGHLEGVWQTVYDRRAKLQARHERKVLAAWRALVKTLDPADVVAVFRRETYQTAEAATKDPTKRWWQDAGAAAALGWLRRLYHADGYQALVDALADAIRAGMAEGEAGALALAAAQAGRTGFPVTKAFKAAYARLANDQAISRKAADAATRLIDATAGNVGRRLAKLAGDGSSEDDMTAGVEDMVNDRQPAQQAAGDAFWTALGAAALSLFGRASQPPPGSSDSGSAVLIDWNSEPSACIICQDNTANGPYQPQDVPAYLAHPNCVIGSTRVAVMPLELLVVPVAEQPRLAGRVAFPGVLTGNDSGLPAATAVAEAVRDFGQMHIRAVTDREYVGDVVTIQTALGHELTATPNHPVATRRGWVPITELQMGDHVLSSTGREWVVPAVDPDVDDVPPRIEQVAQSLAVALGPVPTAAEDFHGDGAGSEVHVVRADGLLMDRGQPGSAQHVGKYQLCNRHGAELNAALLDAKRPGGKKLGGFGLAADGGVSGAGEPGAFFRAGAGHADIHGVASAARLDAGLEQPVTDSRAADAEGFCERLLAFAPGIAADEIVQVKRDVVSAHVYNLETAEGYYIGNGIVTHNCRCWLSAASGLPAWMLASWLAGDD